MDLHTTNSRRCQGFTLAEVCVALVVCVIFAGGAFATNQRLLNAIRNQRETAAAALMLQERMENFRVWPYSSIASYDFVNTYIVPQATKSESALGGGISGGLSETITVSGYLTTSGNGPNPNGYPGDGSTPNKWVRNSQYPNGNKISENDNLATSYNLLQVDILITWTGADGRLRTRDLTAIFGEGNSGW